MSSREREREREREKGEMNTEVPEVWEHRLVRNYVKHTHTCV